MLSKIKEATIPVFILFAVVGLIFAVGLVPFDGNLFLHFSLCCLGIIVGQVVFLFGADNSVLKFGKHAGVSLMQSKKMYLIILKAEQLFFRAKVWAKIIRLLWELNLKMKRMLF